MDRAIIKQDKSDEVGWPVPCRSSSLAALSRLLARQAAREFLNDAGTDGVPREFVDEDRGFGDMSRPASLRASPRAKTDTAGVPACSEGLYHDAKN